MKALGRIRYFIFSFSHGLFAHSCLQDLGKIRRRALRSLQQVTTCCNRNHTVQVSQSILLHLMVLIMILRITVSPALMRVHLWHQVFARYI